MDPSKSPGLSPVIVWLHRFNSCGYYNASGLLCRLSHQNLVFQKSFLPVFGAHASDVERAGGVVVADDIKEVLVIVRWKARVW